MSSGLDRLRVLVVGGTSGIGLAAARLMQGRGAQVAVLGRRPLHLDPLIVVSADVSDDERVRAAVAGATEALGGLDVLVNCAGMAAQGTIESNPDDEWHRVFDVNVLGTVRATRAALPHLRRSERAAIVNVSSVAAIVGLRDRALYAATKGAVQALTLAMATDHLSEGVRVACVAPGTTDTPWIDRLLELADDSAAERAALEARQPHGRLVTADEVAEAIAYLASPASGSTTGMTLTVDGGMTGLRPPARSG